MTAQEYLNELTEDLKNFMEVRNKSMLELDNIFKNKGAKNDQDVMEILKQDKLSEDELDKYYDISQIVTDTNILSRKICDFIQFNRIVNNELELEEVQKIPGFNAFLSDYLPYQTTFVVTPEKLTKETNTEEYNTNKAMFKKTIRNQTVISLINESRN